MTLDSHTNKKVIEEAGISSSKRPQNKIVGFSTHLMKQIPNGLVRGISRKLQEEEHECRMDFVLDMFINKTNQIEVDKESIDMFATLSMSNILGVIQVNPIAVPVTKFGFG